MCIRDSSKTAASNGFESVRIVSRGSRPKDLNSWVDAAFTPVPIERTLMPISELFRQEWLTKSDSYGFDSDLYAAGMKVCLRHRLKSIVKLKQH